MLRNISAQLLTNDLLYESKDSREIEKGSISDSLVRVLVEVPEGLERLGQNPFFSGGEGLRDVSNHPNTSSDQELTGRYTPLSLTTVCGYQSANLL